MELLPSVSQGSLALRSTLFQVASQINERTPVRVPDCLRSSDAHRGCNRLENCRAIILAVVRPAIGLHVRCGQLLLHITN